ncbi:MAG: hypothetical protein LBT45_00555 [Rickettsiales bacterium]|jgi:hypothetical protein|nr:hypothetical protein [Rickettsiales bacterium]
MKKSLLMLLTCLSICPLSLVHRPLHAEDEFGLGDDDALPEGVVINATGIELGQIEAVVLNEDMDYADVENMDISGAMLGMPFEDIQTLFFKTKTLYTPRKDNSIIYTIATDWRYNLDYECRQQGVIVPDKLEKCVLSLARARGLLYPSELRLARPSTGETIDIYFTSNATDNVVWKIVYNNDANETEGAGAKFENQREKKILAFWENVLEKYAAPNSGNDKWVSSDNSFDPMMTAYYGRLELTDLGLAGRDAALNVKQSKENFRPKPYSF